MFSSALVLAAAIVLQGVTGNGLRARAFFDANNVTVGDPLVLTVDFLGEADFTDLHPPVLSKAVDRNDWKLDDASAKTETVANARRLTYRLRPMREGVLWFPPLEFSYGGPDGQARLVRANAIPVHAKGGTQVVVAEMSETEENTMPSPPELVGDAAFGTGAGDAASLLSEDELFRWRKAMAHPTADGFADFGFPAAKMNEATCAIREGNWARALSVYTRLEWRIGQTPQIERGIVAALALRQDNPAVELPVWRQVLRPVLRHGWKGRVGLVVGGFAALVLLFWLLGRGIRAVACVAVATMLGLATTAETTETVTTNADGSVTVTKTVRQGSFSYTSSSTTGGTGGGRMTGGRSLFGSDPFEMFGDLDPFGDRRQRANRPKPQISVSLVSDKPTVTVGENFNLVLSVELPRYVTITEGVRLSIAEQDRLRQTGPVQNLANRPGRNPTNVICRMLFPMRANAPFEGLHYSVDSEYAYVQDRSFFRRSVPFSSGTRNGLLTVRPPPEKGRPADFGGVIAERLSVQEFLSPRRVETNDVVTINYRVTFDGYVPADYLPQDVAFEAGRERDGRSVTYCRYLVADGALSTPKQSFSYYDPRSRSYKTVTVGGTPLAYRPEKRPATDGGRPAN